MAILRIRLGRGWFDRMPLGWRNRARPHSRLFPYTIHHPHRYSGAPSSETLRESRLSMILVPALVWAGLIVFNLHRIQLAGVDRWRDRAEDQQFSDITLAGERGTITDRLGRVIAMSAPAASVYLRPRSITDSEGIIKKVGPLLDLTPKQVSAAVKDSRPFVFLKRQVDRRVAEEVEKLGFKGIGYLPESKRMYPYGTAASALIGAVGLDGHGLSGIEMVQEKKLSTAPVVARMARDAHGGLIQLPMPNSSIFEPQTGHSIQLTIDIELQRILDEELEQGRIASGSVNGFAVLVDSETGDILSISQAPSPDFNVLRKYQPKQLRNFTAEATFEPGSILKAVVAAGALERGVVRPGEMIDCERGSYRYAGRIVHDAHPSSVISFHDVVVRSSNIGMTKIGERLGRSNLFGILQRFGFGKSTDLGVPGESSGILRPASSWAQIDVATHSYGQGVAVTPLQVVRAMSALANGGTLNPLRLITGRQAVDEPRRVISPKTARLIEEMLIGVVEDEHGTGSFAAIPGVRVGGKTGTAQKARLGGKGYVPGKYISSFVGFADAANLGVENRLVLLVTMDEPSRGSYYGGIVAAPVFQKAMKRILEQLSLRSVLRPPTVTAQREVRDVSSRLG